MLNSWGSSNEDFEEHLLVVLQSSKAVCNLLLLFLPAEGGQCQSLFGYPAGRWAGEGHIPQVAPGSCEEF